jgi:hypothetical protein
MTPQQKKADELVERFWIYAAANQKGSWKNAIQCAIICVEEILVVVESDESAIIVELQYWQSVLNEFKSRL